MYVFVQACLSNSAPYNAPIIFLFVAEKKTLTWVDITRKSIKSKLGFGWSVQGIEKQNKVKTKVVYRFSTGQRTTVLTDLDWHAENNNEITNLVVELSDLMNERSVDLVKAYELINGGKLNKMVKMKLIGLH